MWQRWPLSLGMVLALLACGGGGAGSSPGLAPLKPQIFLSMTGQILRPGETRSIRVDSTEDPSTTEWAVTGGTLSPSGQGPVYTAPSTPGRFEIRGRFKGNPTVTATLVVHVVTIQVEVQGTLPAGPGWGSEFKVDALPDGRILINAWRYAAPMIWDPVARTGVSTGPCPMRPSKPEMARLQSGRLIQVGGGAWGSPNACDILEYNPQADSWAKSGEVYYTRVGDQTSTVMRDGRLLIAGGLTGGGGQNPTMEIWDPSLGGVATVFANLQIPRSGHTATLMPDGSVLMAGGLFDKGSVDRTEWVAANLQSRPGPDLMVSRNNHSALLLGDGRVLMVGGGTSALLEAYNPAKGLFEACGTMDAPAISHPAVSLLSSGKVVIMGGVLPGTGLPTTDAVQVWIPELHECRTLATLPVPIYGAKAVAGATDSAFLVGGLNASSEPRTEVIAIKVQ